MAIQLDGELRKLLDARDTAGATTLVLRELGPEVLGFLCGVLGDDAGDEVFSRFSESLWRSLETYQSKCTIRTWAYMLARHEIARYRKGVHRHERGRVPISELADVLQAVRKTHTTLAAHRRATLARLRDELSIEDRTLLILRVDRDLSFDDIAITFADNPDLLDKEALRREAGRLRKRFQLIKERLMARVREIEAEGAEATPARRAPSA